MPAASMTQRSAAANLEAIDVMQYYPLVEQVAKRLARRLPAHVEREDLISAGVVGLLESARRFDPSRSDAFETFAEFRIKGAMLDELRHLDSLSRTMRRHYGDVREATKKLESVLGREPTEDEIASELDMSLEEYRELVTKFDGHTVSSLDEIDTERVAAEGASPDEEAATCEMRAKIAEAIEKLPARQRQVLWLYYFEEMSLRAIGNLLGVTESRICQIHSEATKALRRQLLHAV